MAPAEVEIIVVVALIIACRCSVCHIINNRPKLDAQ